MATVVIMPRQGQSVESCIVTKWEKKKGDPVKAGDVLFSYETDKSSFEELAMAEGVLLEVFAEEGDDVPCLDPVCIIGEPGEDISDLIPSKASEQSPEKIILKEETSVMETTKTVDKTAEIAADNTHTTDINKISPRAKALSEKVGVDINKAISTGPGGRIIERDINDLLDKGYFSEQNQDTLIPKIDDKIITDTEYTDIPLTNIRKFIAKAMHASLSTMAQLTLNSSFDATEIQALRSQLKEKSEEMEIGNITFNDMVLFAVSRALKNHKDLNAHYLDDKIRRFNGVHLGIAVDTDRGLVVPTLFNADKLSLQELSSQAKTLIKDAQAGTISPDYLKGASFTVTNLGSLGVESFTPVINPPQTAILGVDNIARRIKQVDGQDVFYSAMGLSLTFDHRAVDGAPAARLLKEICTLLENFRLLLVR